WTRALRRSFHIERCAFGIQCNAYNTCNCINVLRNNPSQQSYAAILHSNPTQQSYATILRSNPTQQSCTAILRSNPTQQSCTAILHSNPTQQSYTAIQHSNPTQQSYAAILHSNPAQQSYTKDERINLASALSAKVIEFEHKQRTLRVCSCFFLRSLIKFPQFKHSPLTTDSPIQAFPSDNWFRNSSIPLGQLIPQFKHSPRTTDSPIQTFPSDN
ncbi:hypothetical protein FHG87_023438, partial [Trinorchestia longiramus]